jgi:ketosteroid isomerase-like protein
MATAAQTDARAEFAAYFADGWAIGAADPDAFFAHFAARMTPDAVFEQPLAPARRGPDGLRMLLDPLFEALPDLRGELIRWGATDDGVIAELRLSSASTGIGWTTLDVIELRDGRIARRVAHFDPLPLLVAVLRRPRVAARLLPSLRRRR